MKPSPFCWRSGTPKTSPQRWRRSVTLPCPTPPTRTSAPNRRLFCAPLASFSGKSEAALPVPLKTPGGSSSSVPTPGLPLRALFLGFSAKALSTRDNLTLASGVTDFLALYQARTFYSAGLLVSSSPDFSTDRKKLLTAVENLYGTLSLRYRLDVWGEEVTQELRSEVRKASSPSLRVRPFKTPPRIMILSSSACALIRRTTSSFSRLPAQTGALTIKKRRSPPPFIRRSPPPACILCDLSPAARVLDPFCGSGTMFERGACSIVPSRARTSRPWPSKPPSSTRRTRVLI